MRPKTVAGVAARRINWTYYAINKNASFRTKLSFRFGGLITLVHCSIPVQGSQVTITPENALKRVCLWTLLSPQLSLSLSLAIVSF